MEAMYKYLPDNKINWDLILNELLMPFKDSLEKTNQEMKWHGEGNVLIHTKMVCEALIKLDEYKLLNKDERLVLFLSALFHDIAKPVCTKIVGGEITSPNHGPVGASITREYLYTKYNLAGKKKYLSIREGICLLIKYHTSLLHIDNNEAGIKRLIKLSLNNSLTSYFNIRNLAILSKADVLGRISNDTDMQLKKLDNSILLAKEINVYDRSFTFSNSFTKYKYLNNDNIWYNQTLYDDTWGEVIMMSGLPGVGKDTYIKNNLSLPVISLDDIRNRLNIKPTDDQGMVINEAINIAKGYLRYKQPFIWNATNTSYMIRKKIINIINDYHAKIKIIYLEASYQETLKRNNERNKKVPNSVIDKLLMHMNIPEAYEVHEVIWHINE